MSKHKRTRIRQPTPARPERTAIGDLTLIVAELVRSVDTVERYTYWKPGRDAGERREHKTSGRGLLVQLAEAAGVRELRPDPGTPNIPVALEPLYDVVTGKRRAYRVTYIASRDAAGMATSSNTGAARYDEGGHSAPGSRLPSAAVYVDEYVRLSVEIWRMRTRLAQEQGITWLRGGDPAEALDDILTLAVHVPPAMQDRVVGAARAWASAARVVLSYEAPWVALRDWCPFCGGDLKVRADATSDVVCRGGDRVFLDVPWSLDHIEHVKAYGCGARTPRSQWVRLLTELNRANRARVEGQAWLDHEAWLADQEHAELEEEPCPT